MTSLKQRTIHNQHWAISKQLITAGSLPRKQATVQAKLGKSDRTF